MKRAPLSRRAVLRGFGTVIALPFLDAMVPSLLRAAPVATPPKRFMAFYTPNGYHMPAFTPAGAGNLGILPPILAPLDPVKSELLVLTGLANRPAQPDGAGDHAAGTGSFITNAHVKKSESDILAGVSLDQVIADTLAAPGQFRSLEVGCEGGASTGNCDSGYSCAYVRNISWSSPTSPRLKETSAKALFDKLFAGYDPNETEAAKLKRKAYKQSVLDFALADAKSLRTKLGPSDQAKLDEFSQGIFELEGQLEKLEAGKCGPSQPLDLAPANFPDYVKILLDVMVLAFQCDLTRVQTFMLGNGGSERVYDFLGITDGHHYLSHHQNDGTKQAKLQAIGTWQIEQFAYLLGKLSALDEGGTSVLDESIVFLSSEIEDGNTHSHFNMPILVAGKAGGQIVPGRHLVYSNAPPVGNLFVTFLQAMGSPATQFGDDGVAPLAL
jgi:hypothetical protein